MARAPDRSEGRRASRRAYHGSGTWLALLVAAGWITAFSSGSPARAAGATRVVSLSPVGTRVVLALGHGDRLVAVDAASAALPGMQHLPVTESAGAAAQAPDLVLVPAAEAEALRRAAPFASQIEVAPHNFDDAWALCLVVGAALGREEDARRFVRETSRPLAEIGSESFGRRRPRVAAVLGLEPLEVAGGHSFVTDLIELAGGESVSHGTEEPRLTWTPAELARAEPELVVIVTVQPASAQERQRVSQLFDPALPVEFLVLDAERDWLGGALPAARRLRAWIAARGAEKR